MTKREQIYTPSEDLVTIVTTVGRATAYIESSQFEHFPYGDVGRETNKFLDDVEDAIRRRREANPTGSSVKGDGSPQIPDTVGETGTPPVPAASKTDP